MNTKAGFVLIFALALLVGAAMVAMTWSVPGNTPLAPGPTPDGSPTMVAYQGTDETSTLTPTPTLTSTSSGAGVRITVVQPPTVTKGQKHTMVDYKIRWGVTDPATEGAIVQHIRYKVDVQDSEGNTIDSCYDGFQFWEAWEVTKDGQIWVGDSDGIKGDRDRYAVLVTQYGEHTKGKWKVIGRVRFIENYDIKSFMDGWTPGLRGGCHWTHGPLLFRRTKPVGWSDEGALEHNLTVEWDCTSGTCLIETQAYP